MFNVAEPALYLIGGIGGVLTLASLIGIGLKARIAGDAPHAALDNLNDRIRAWWIIAALFGLALAGGAAALSGLFALASFTALREFTAPIATSKSERALGAAAFYVVTPLHYLSVFNAAFAAFAALIPIVACVVLAMGTGGAAGISQAYARRIALGLLICVYLVSHVPALFTLAPAAQANPAYLVAFLVVVVQASDVLQYLWGKLAGRRKIAPRISPSKTLAGTIGGIASASLLGAAAAPITPFSVTQAFAVALLLTVLGFTGGLFLSALKRRRGIKDWGNAIAGHGGVLDRVDSLCLSAPALFYLLRLGVLPWVSFSPA